MAASTKKQGAKLWFRTFSAVLIAGIILIVINAASRGIQDKIAEKTSM